MKNIAFDYGRLTYYSLVVLAIIPAVRGFELSVWEIIRLLLITLGIAWLILKRAPLLNGTSPYAAVLFSSVYMYILVQFGWKENGVVPLGFLFIGLLVVFAITGTFGKIKKFKFSKLDRFIAVIGGMAVGSSISIQLVLGPEGGQEGLMRWVGAFQIVELILIYFTFSRLFQLNKGLRQGMHLLYIVSISFILVCLLGVFRTVSAFYYSDRAIHSFQSGQYENAWQYASTLSGDDLKLNFKFLSLEWTLGKMLSVAQKTDAEACVKVGKIAGGYGFWDLSAAAYRAALERDSLNVIVQTHLANSLFEQGWMQQAFDLYRKSITRAEVQPESYLAFGIALARVGEWGEAEQMLERAVEAVDFESKVDALFSPGQRLVRKPIKDLLPAEFSGYLQKFTFFDVVKLFERKGFNVLHPALKIGATDVETPVEVEARSASSGMHVKEYIRVGGRQYSPQKRGYNIVVIHPQTGKVEEAVNFDTWEDLHEGQRLTRYLKAIPKGKIVVATIDDEGSGGMTGHTKAAFRQIGVNRFPESWWSHAAIGVKGSARGSALEVLGQENSLALVGVLAANVDKETVENSDRLEKLLLSKAVHSPMGVALYIPSLSPGAIVIIAHKGKFLEK